MKHLKMLGLAAIAALGLMAFVGAGSASATTLFTDEAHKIDYPAGTQIHATLVSGSTAILTGSGGEVLDTCTVSTVLGDTSETSGSPLKGIITKITWEKCTTTTDTVAPGALSIEYTSGNSGTLSGSGSEVTVNIFGVSCTYGTGAGTPLGTFTGGSAPVMKINAVKLTKTAGGFLCPSNPGWDAEYVVTEPHAIYLTK